jgi:uncharacterized protein YjiS (DUF1127 family)
MRLPRLMAVWIERSRQRRALADMVDRDDPLLADIGVSCAQARDEAAKPFWVVGRRGEDNRLAHAWGPDTALPVRRP